MKRAISLILIAVMLCGAFMLAGCKQKQQTIPQSGVGLVVDPNQGDYVAPEQGDGSTSGIAIPGWGEITIPPNKADNIKVDFYNPEENAGKFYLTFQIRLPDNSAEGYEVLYTSGLIEPGKHIYSINLSRGIEEGEYEAIIHCQPYKMDETKTPTNNADLKTLLIVK